MHLADAKLELVTLRVPAMACEFSLQFSAEISDRTPAFSCLGQLEELEAQLSLYRDDSELTHINRRAASEPVAVEPSLFALLRRCQGWSIETDGAFDVSSGPLVRCWGFFQRQGRIPDALEWSQARELVGMNMIYLDRDMQTVSFAKMGMEINLGGVGKGFAIDRAGTQLRTAGYSAFLMGAGGSSIRAWGHPPWDDAWHVEIRHPLQRSRPLVIVQLVNQSLSTSSVGEQYFESEGKRYGHVLDPRTGAPASGMLQATALAPNAAEAEALSTAFFINGVDWTDAYCREHPHIGAILIPQPDPGHDLHMVVLGGFHDLLVLPEPLP
jgi:thiamine biosynthesis lipoprotein